MLAHEKLKIMKELTEAIQERIEAKIKLCRDNGLNQSAHVLDTLNEDLDKIILDMKEHRQ